MDEAGIDMFVSSGGAVVVVACFVPKKFFLNHANLVSIFSSRVSTSSFNSCKDCSRPSNRTPTSVELSQTEGHVLTIKVSINRGPTSALLQI